MMRCEECQTLLADYVARALPVAQQRELDAHLTLCPGCQGELAAERRLEQLFTAVPLASPSPDFTWHVLTRIQQERRPAPVLAGLMVSGLSYAASLVALLVGLNRLPSLLPSGVRQALGPSLWDRVQGAFLQGLASLEALVDKSGGLVPSSLLQGITPLGAFGVLAVLTLYLSLAEEA